MKIAHLNPVIPTLLFSLALLSSSAIAQHGGGHPGGGHMSGGGFHGGGAGFSGSRGLSGGGFSGQAPHNAAGRPPSSGYSGPAARPATTLRPGFSPYTSPYSRPYSNYPFTPRHGFSSPGSVSHGGAARPPYIRGGGSGSYRTPYRHPGHSPGQNPAQDYGWYGRHHHYGSYYSGLFYSGLGFGYGYGCGYGYGFDYGYGFGLGCPGYFSGFDAGFNSDPSYTAGYYSGSAPYIGPSADTAPDPDGGSGSLTYPLPPDPALDPALDPSGNSASEPSQTDPGSANESLAAARVAAAPAREPVPSAAESAGLTLIYKAQRPPLYVASYVLTSSAVYAHTPTGTQTILLSEIDLPATQKINRDRGVEFNLPGSR